MVYKKQVGIMVKIRGYGKKETRRERVGIFLPSLLFFILFPYIISSFSEAEKQTFEPENTLGQIYVIEKRIWGGRKIPLEEYLTGMLAATIPPEYEPETLKAQAVILRSYCVNYMKKEEGRKVIYEEELEEYYVTEQECEKVWKEETDLHLQKMQNAVNDTKGLILVSDGDVVKPPFCRMSNGKSRDITEYVAHKENYGYMKTVTCSKDCLAADFIQYQEISQKEFEKILGKLVQKKTDNLKKIILYRDNNGYVKEVQIGEEKIDGDRFRETLKLQSSSYSLDKIDNTIEIQTKGIGHGFGFVQYEANELAKNEKDYMDLLNYFFDNISFEKL